MLKLGDSKSRRQSKRKKTCLQKILDRHQEIKKTRWIYFLRLLKIFLCQNKVMNDVNFKAERLGNLQVNFKTSLEHKINTFALKHKQEI